MAANVSVGSSGGIGGRPVQNAQWNYNGLGGSWVTAGERGLALPPTKPAPQPVPPASMPPMPPLPPPPPAPPPPAPVKVPDVKEPPPSVAAMKATDTDTALRVGEGQPVYVNPNLGRRNPPSLEMLLQGLRY